MKYIVVRTYGNGKCMNKICPLYFEWLSQAERYCDELNDSLAADDGDKWIVMPIMKWEGPVWKD